MSATGCLTSESDGKQRPSDAHTTSSMRTTSCMRTMSSMRSPSRDFGTPRAASCIHPTNRHLCPRCHLWAKRLLDAGQRILHWHNRHQSATSSMRQHVINGIRDVMSARSPERPRSKDGSKGLWRASTDGTEVIDVLVQLGGLEPPTS